jgi:hypothetical protein
MVVELLCSLLTRLVSAVFELVPSGLMVVREVRMTVLPLQLTATLFRGNLRRAALYFMGRKLGRIVEISSASVAAKLVGVRAGRCWHESSPA